MELGKEAGKREKKRCVDVPAVVWRWGRRQESVGKNRQSRKKKWKSDGYFCLIRLITAVTLGTLAAIIGFILVRGIPGISLGFLTGKPQMLGKEGGIFPMIAGTLYVTLLSILIATPIGTAAAIYFSEYAKKGTWIRVIRFFTEVLGGIPSIIFGLFGFAFFVVFLGMGWSVLSGGLTLSMMILPTLVRSTEESLKTVPMAYREGSLSLGATKWETVVKVALPCCKPGILTGLVLGIGRAVGETAALMLTVGGSLVLPLSPLDSTRTMAMHLYTLASEGLSEEKTYATAALLIIIVLAINSLANYIGGKLAQETRDEGSGNGKEARSREMEKRRGTGKWQKKKKRLKSGT